MQIRLTQNTSIKDVLIQIDNKEDMEDFLRGILTPKEYEEISLRLKILRLLKLGVPHRQIAEDLGVGTATVTRGSKELQNDRFKYISSKKA